MTMKQIKVIGAAFLTLPFLLLIIGTFDSQQSHLTAQGESSGITSHDNLNLRKAESNLPAQRLAIAQALPKIVEIERVDENEHGPGDEGDGNRGHENDKDKHGPGSKDDDNKGHGNDSDGHDEDNPGNSRHGDDGDKGKDHDRGHDNNENDDDEHGSGEERDGNKGHDNDEDEHGSKGDGNSGHDNDEDDDDEDNS